MYIHRYKNYKIKSTIGPSNHRIVRVLRKKESKVFFCPKIGPKVEHWYKDSEFPVWH